MCFITWPFAWQKILPPGYIHLLCHHELLEMSGDVENFRAALKLQLITEEQVQRWLEDFQKTSALTWRKSRTYPDSGRYNKYRVGTSCYVTEKCFKGNLISKLSLFTFFRHCYWMWFISAITFSKMININVIMVTGIIAKKVWKKKLISCSVVKFNVRSFSQNCLSTVFCVYQVDLRCQHKTYSSSSKTSKNTNCPATMFLILKRYMYERKSRWDKNKTKVMHYKNTQFNRILITQTFSH